LNILRYYNWLNKLPEHVQSELLAAMTKRSLAADEAVFHVGDSSSELYQIVKGQIKCNLYSFDGQEVIIGTLQAGETFGEQGLLDNLPRATNTYAIGETVLNVLPQNDFIRMSMKHPELNAQLIVMFSQRMRMAFEIHADNITLSLCHRLSRCLYRLTINRYACPEKQDQLLVDVSHESLARMVGASRQRVSKELKLMEKSGIISIQYGKILINNYVQLAKEYGLRI